LELKKTKFTIFAPLSDYGYFGWNPGDERTKMKALSTVKSDEIKDHIALEHKPRKLVDISQLHLPQRFRTDLPPLQHPSLFPFRQYYSALLPVPTKHRGVSLKDLDFVFGGSILRMLARRDASDPFKVVRIPFADNAILVVNCKQFISDYSELGYQFERLVTGLAMECLPNDVIYNEHLHMMRIGAKYNVLFCTATNAIDGTGDPVKVTASNPRFWGTKTMFQMISNGYPTMCHGIKANGRLLRIDRIRLASVIHGALRDVSYNMFQDNIMSGMKAIREKMKSRAVGDVFSVYFDRYGKLKLLPMTGNSIVFPPSVVVEELLPSK
jgi:hypothetical protein